MCKSMCSYSGNVRIAVAAVASTRGSSRGQMGGVHENSGHLGRVGRGAGAPAVSKRERHRERRLRSGWEGSSADTTWYAQHAGTPTHGFHPVHHLLTLCLSLHLAHSHTVPFFP